MPKNWNKTVSIQEAKAAYAVGDDLDAYCFLYEGDRVRPVRITASGDIVTLPPYVPPVTLYTKTGKFINSLVANIVPVQEGTGDPSPDNIRPISGWTGAKVTRTGKNFWGGSAFAKLAENWTDAVVDTTAHTLTGSISKLENRAKVFEMPFKQNTQYTIFMHTNIPNIGFYVVYTDGTERNISPNIYVTATNKTIAYLKFYIATSSKITFYYDDIGVFEGVLTADDFEPYQGQSYDIVFPSEASPVYGGTLDVTSGELIVTDAMIASYNGEPLPSTWISDRDVYAEGATPTTGAQVVYKLANPQTYKLTPTEVTLLAEENNIYANTGSINLTYVETQEV